MKEKITVWTKQNAGILKDLEENSRYIVKKEYITAKMQEHSGLYLDVYDWYTKKAEKYVKRPEDVQFPVWVSLTEETSIGNSEGNVVLELDINKEDLIIVDLDKWGLIVNYMYIPKDAEDKREHEKFLKTYGTDDIQAYMSPYYPNIKKKIIKSWDLLFDESIKGTIQVGTLWEIKKEWIKKVIQ